MLYQHFAVSSNFSADSPAPVPCPIGGRFVFHQKGGSPLLPRVVGGITSSPLDSYPCPVRHSVMSICGSERKWIEIDLNLCVSLNKDGHPLDFNSESCVGKGDMLNLSFLVKLAIKLIFKEFTRFVMTKVVLLNIYFNGDKTTSKN